MNRVTFPAEGLQAGPADLSALVRLDAMPRGLIRNGSDLLLVLSADGSVRWAGPSVERLAGIPAYAATLTVELLFHPDDVGSFRQALAVAQPGRDHALSVRICHRDGSIRWLDAALHCLEEGTGLVVFTGRDVTEQRLLEQQLHHWTAYDPVTGLLNRAGLLARIEDSRPSGSAAGRLALLLIEPGGFDAVTDGLGHNAGDELLAAIAQRLSMCLLPDDLVARLEGETFAVLVRGGRHASTLATAERIVTALRLPFRAAGQEIILTPTVGIAQAAPGTCEAAKLASRAALALRQAKMTGKDRIARFEPWMEHEAAEQLRLLADLRWALERHQLELHYQPEVDLVTGQLIGVEALVRWRHPLHGLIPPDRFIPLAEQTGLIVPIGDWVLGEACRQAQTWIAALPSDQSFLMAVNLSARQFTRPDLLQRVTRVLADARLQPTSLELEITESTALHDVPEKTTNLRGLKALGVRVALDDFGTGYASLSTLRGFPVDTLKIDRSFVGELDKDRSAHAIAYAVTGLAHSLHMEVTAEGIETATHLATVRDMGCDRGQGYLFARPLPGAEVSAFLASESFPLPELDTK